jgi:hypothetical protein
MNNIEQLFSQLRDQEATLLIERLALPNIIQWEKESLIFRSGLARINWWESLFSHTYPLTFERLKKSIGRRANASILFFHRDNVWRSLFILIIESDRTDRGVWQIGTGAQSAIQLADEFGIDQIHILNRRFIKAIDLGKGEHTFDLASPAFTSLGLEKKVIMIPIQLWSVPFQKAVIVMLQNTKSEERELVWIPTSAPNELEYSNWAINHNNLTENPEDFCSPPFLHGDPTLNNVVIASTEGRTDIPTAKTAVVTVTIRNRDTLIFDQVKQNHNPAKHWRQLLTDELWEPRNIPMTSSCFVLDSYLLYASNDGILRAHPRGNPKSTYHGEELQSLVPQMTSLFNVVALIHSHDKLEVRHVEKQQDDPFLHFRIVYQTRLADESHRPLLYGPYLIFRSLDGSWYRVMYDSVAQHKELIKIPFKAGWIIVSVKNANWRYWTVVLKSPKGEIEEFILFSGGLAQDGSNNKPFFIAACLDCGERATHLCKNCVNVGFCLKHTNHKHPNNCH